MVTTTLLSLSKNNALHSVTAAAAATTSSTAATIPNPSSCIVKLYSLDAMNDHKHKHKNLRIIHLVRHAEGYHNVNKDYKNPAHIDAELTPKGIEQCQLLSKRLAKSSEECDTFNALYDVECIISSPMRRALQTAQHSFEHKLQLQLRLDDETDDIQHNSPIPFVACEDWRETVNYLCDQRLSSNALKSSFPFVDFDHIQHEIDPIWAKYESRFGSHTMYTKGRESIDDEGLVQRATRAWEFIQKRKEHNIAVVSHSAFFMHVFTRPELGIVQYEDEDVETLMTEKSFENCEMRSVAFEVVSTMTR